MRLIPNPFILYIAVMSIEKEIQQSKFRNAFQKAAINLIYTVGWIRERTRSVFEAEDITPQQFNILRILRGSFPKPLSTLQIRERMLEKMSDTSRIVDRLISKGLVKKVTCKVDRRLVDVIITDKGKKLLERLDARESEIDGVLGNLSEKDANMLSDLLDKIRDGGE
jgi:MarR family transcriptional regulator, 2-MHQ and catechol-resistance regulon repressor